MPEEGQGEILLLEIDVHRSSSASFFGGVRCDSRRTVDIWFFFFSTFPPRLWYVALFSHQLQLRQSFGLENVLSFLFEIENSSFFSSQWSLLIFFRSHWLHTAFSVATGEVIFFFFIPWMIFILFFLSRTKNGGLFWNSNCFPKKKPWVISGRC